MARRPKTTPRRSRITPRTAALVVLCVVSVALFANLVPIHSALYGTPVPLSFLLGAALCVAPLLAISHPRWATALLAAAVFTVPLIVDREHASHAPWPWSVPALLVFVVFVGVITFLHGIRFGSIALITAVIASLTAPLLRPDMVSSPAAAGNATADTIVTVSIGAAMLLIAALVAGRLRVAEELTREKEHSALEQSRRALVEERTRIARELHDVVAHSMSVIQVQASTARYRLPEIGDVAAAEFDDIAATARGSLTEMRRLLGVLRTEDQSTELTPQQGIDDVPALVDSIRRAGVEVGLMIEGGDTASAAAPGVQIATFRIIQEALSNAVRHAPGARIAVRLHADAEAIRIRVHNAAPPRTPEGHGTGYGLRGMRERAELLGGSLSARADSDGGWTVEALLPLGSDGAAPTSAPISGASGPDKENP